jgi:hypothetical protein
MHGQNHIKFRDNLIFTDSLVLSLLLYRRWYAFLHLSDELLVNVRVKSSSCFNYQLNAQFLYCITIYMLHYSLRRVSSITMLIFRRDSCIITAPVNSCTVRSLLSTDILYSCLQAVTIPGALIIQLSLLKMSI